MTIEFSQVYFFVVVLGVLWLWNNLHQVFQVGWQPKIIDDLLMWASPRFYSGFCKPGCEVTWFKNMQLIQYFYSLSKVNSVKEGCVKCFEVHILKFEILIYW